MHDQKREELERIVRELQQGIGEPHWEPLERFCKQALYEPSASGGFMFMGAALGPEGDRLVYLYKHGMTRSYLNLDADLNTYVYRGDRGGVDAFGDPLYEPIGVNQAIANLGLERLPRMGADLTTPYDDEYRAKRDQSLAEAGWTVVAPQPEDQS